MENFLKKRKASTQDENVGPSHETEDNDMLDDPPSAEPDQAMDEDNDDVPSDEPDDDLDDVHSLEREHDSVTNTGNSSQDQEDINWEEDIEFDPGKRRSIDEYPPNIKDMVRRKYLANGPCQPRTYHFPTRKYVVEIGDSIQNGLISMGVGLNTASPRTKHIVFFVSYSDAAVTKKLDMQHLC